MRNTPWARHFFSEVNRLGRLDDHHKGKNTLSAVSGMLICFAPHFDVSKGLPSSMLSGTKASRIVDVAGIVDAWMLKTLYI